MEEQNNTNESRNSQGQTSPAQGDRIKIESTGADAPHTDEPGGGNMPGEGDPPIIVSG